MVLRDRDVAAVAGLLACLVAVGCGAGGDKTTTVVVHEAAAESEPAQKPRAKPARDPGADPDEAAQWVEDFYSLIDSYYYRRAWKLLPGSVRAEAETFAAWRSGYRNNLRSIPHDIRVASFDDGSAVITLKLEARDIDVCGGPRVEQTFQGSWSFSADGSSWQPDSIQMEKVAGGDPVQFVRDCPGGSSGGGNYGYGGGGGGGGGGAGYGSGGGGAGYYSQPQGTYGGDGTIDCDQIGSSDIYVGSDDPNGLDADGDGYACES